MGEPHNPGDDALLALTPHEPEAFGTFYRRHEDAVLGYMLRRTRDPEWAADLVAETFAAALSSLHRYRPGREPAIAWLFGIARNVLGHSLRRGAVEDRARRRLGMERPELDERQRKDLEALLDDVAIEQLLASLPADQADAIRARYLGDETYEEIAGRTRSSEVAVRKRVSRGLAFLRARWKEER
jgi:RNA polymerase sigma-70 factor (ECF subfamily)